MRKLIYRQLGWCCVLTVLLIVGAKKSRAQSIVGNSGFEALENSGVFPTAPAELQLSDIWKDDKTPAQPVGWHSPDYYYAQSWTLEEDIDANGVFTTILGRDNSEAYVGMRPCEMIYQELSTGLTEGKTYVVQFYIRFPHANNRVEQDVSKSYPIGDQFDIEITFSKHQPFYINNEMSCLFGGNKCYGLDFEGNSPIQELEIKNISPQNFPAGQWIKVISNPFEAKKNLNYFAFQTASDAGDNLECETYMLIDDVKIYDVDCTSPEPCLPTCEFLMGPQVVYTNSINDATVPLTIFGLSNLDAIGISIFDGTSSLAHTASYQCPNGWEDDMMQLELPATLIGAQYYTIDISTSNPCGVCHVASQFFFADLFTGPIDDCGCRLGGTIKPCCKEVFEAEKFTVHCPPSSTVSYEAITDLNVGVSQSYVIDPGEDVYFTASNSITFGSGFATDVGGTFIAEVSDCSSNKRSDAEGTSTDNIHPTANQFLEQAFFRCYPNPVQDQLAIVSLHDREFKCALFNAHGESVRQITVLPTSTTFMSTDGLPGGVYFVKGQSAERNWIERIVVQ